MADHLEHRFTIPLLGGMLGCSIAVREAGSWRTKTCRASMKAPTAPVLAVESSETSVAAARRVSGVRAHALRVAAFQAFQRAGAIGLTDDELLMALQTGEPDVRDNSTRPRRFDLERENIVHKAGRTRPTRTGSPAEVYVLVDLSKGGDA